MVRTIVAFLVSLTLFTWASMARAVTVAFVETVDEARIRVKVSDAEGKSQEEAKGLAAREALVFAAKRLTGSETEKTRLETVRMVYEPWVADLCTVRRVLKVTFTDKGQKIDVLVDVNIKDLRRRLEAKGLLTKMTDLAEELGNPVIMVVPAGKEGKKVNPPERYLIDRIASFFTQRKFDLVDAQAIKNVREMTKAAEAIEGVFDDPVAEVAALVGADIYVTYTAGQTEVVKASASLKAYETTTGRLIASATGESRHYPAGYALMDAIREAVSDAIPKLLEDISGYWHQDIRKGRRYMLSISGDLSDRAAVRALKRNLRDVGKLKVNIQTKKKLVAVLRAHGEADEVQDQVQDAIEDAGFKSVELILANRQLLIFAIR